MTTFTITDLTIYLALIGTFAFAVSGALQAARKQMDIVGYIFIAAVVGIGGGTLRDLMLSQPVFWLESPVYLYLCIAGACITFLFAKSLSPSDTFLVWFDAIGLAVFTVLGVKKALALDANYTAAIVMGLSSATLGGILRDVICNEVPILLRKEFYITASFFGALVTILVNHFFHLESYALLLGFLTTLFARAAGIIYRFHLPARPLGENRFKS